MLKFVLDTHLGKRKYNIEKQNREIKKQKKSSKDWPQSSSMHLLQVSGDTFTIYNTGLFGCL